MGGLYGLFTLSRRTCSSRIILERLGDSERLRNQVELFEVVPDKCVPLEKRLYMYDMGGKTRDGREVSIDAVKKVSRDTEKGELPRPLNSG